jgi:hypothetical protein
VRRSDRSHATALSCEVTVVKAATADYSDKEMLAALNINIPNDASAVTDRRFDRGSGQLPRERDTPPQ